MPETLIPSQKKLVEVYKTDNAAISQCDLTERYTLSHHQMVIDLKLCELIKLRNKLNAINIDELLDSNLPDIEIIYLPMSNRMLVVGIMDILELRSLISGAFVMLELNSVIHKSIFRKY